MTRLEAPPAVLQKKPSEVYAFLSDFNNYQKVMPDEVAGWTSTTDTCSFTVKGLASLSMKIAERKPDSLVVVVPDGKAPFDYKLICEIAEAPEGSVVNVAIEADMNPFVKMMAERPLKNFLNAIGEKLKQI